MWKENPLSFFFPFFLSLFFRAGEDTQVLAHAKELIYLSLSIVLSIQALSQQDGTHPTEGRSSPLNSPACTPAFSGRTLIDATSEILLNSNKMTPKITCHDSFLHSTRPMTLSLVLK